MESSVFDEYSQDLTALLSSLSSKLTNEAPSQKGDARKAILRRVEMELEEADEIIAQMEIEVQTADRDKSTISAKLREFKSSLAKHKMSLNTLSKNSDRDELLFSSTDAHTTLEMDAPDRDENSASPAQLYRSKLLNDTERLNEGQRRLEDSHRIALETENLGGGILRNLRDQRETLEHTRDNLYEADGSIDRASNTLKQMVRRMYQQRAATYAIIGILVFLILYVLFSKIFSS